MTKSSQIEPKQVWQCPLSKKCFDSKEACENHTRSVKAAKTRKENKEKKKLALLKDFNEKQRYIIDNATSFEDIFRLLIAKSKEFWDVHITELTVTSVYLKFDREKGEHKWTFRIKIQAGPLSKKALSIQKEYMKAVYGSHCYFSRPGISDMFSEYRNDFPAFLGIRLGSGNGGSFGSYELNMDGSISIKDYKHLAPLINHYVEFRDENQKYIDLIKGIDREGSIFCDTVTEVNELRERIQALDREKNNLNNELSHIKNRAKQFYVQVAQGGVEHLKPVDSLNVANKFEVDGDFHFNSSSP